MSEADIQHLRLGPGTVRLEAGAVNVVEMLFCVGVQTSVVGAVASGLVGREEKRSAIRGHDWMGFLRIRIECERNDRDLCGICKLAFSKADLC